MNARVLLRLRNAPALRVDVAEVRPGASADDVARTRLWHGREQIALGELFDVSTQPGETDAAELVFEGDLARIDGIGRGLQAGTIRVHGSAGDYAGAQMSGGELLIDGNAGVYAGCEMSGGRIAVGGNVGDFAAGALAGSMDGMRGGVIEVRGNAGERCADRMRRGVFMLHGNAGDFLASRMVAGTLAIAGSAGAHCGYAMRRGTLVFAGAQPELPATFAPSRHDIRVYWALLARSLERIGGAGSAFAGLAARQPRRAVGDLAADGKGEWLLPD